MANDEIKIIIFLKQPSERNHKKKKKNSPKTYERAGKKRPIRFPTFFVTSIKRSGGWNVISWLRAKGETGYERENYEGKVEITSTI